MNISNTYDKIEFIYSETPLLIPCSKSTSVEIIAAWFFAYDYIALLRYTSLRASLKASISYCLPGNLIFSCCFQANEVSLKKSNFWERLCSSQGARIKFYVLLFLLAAARNLMGSEGDPPDTDSILECVKRLILKEEGKA